MSKKAFTQDRADSSQLGVSHEERLWLLLAAIEDATGTSANPCAGGYFMRCPAHDDTHASLSVGYGDKGILLHCHAGCEFAEVLDALDWPQSEVFWDSLVPQTGVHQPEVVGETVHRYRDCSGREVAVNLRRDLSDGSKTFALERYIEDEVLVYGAERLPQAIEENRLVWLVEGEKCVDALTGRGEVAISLHGGALSSARGDRVEHLCDLLQGTRVVICPDGDTQGDTWRRNMERGLESHCKVMTTVDVKAMQWSNGYDIADWLAENPNEDPREDLRTNGPLIRSAAESKPLERPRWIWDRRIPLDAISLIAGDPGNGKSSLVAHLAARLSRGELEGEFLGTPQHTLVLAREETENTVRLKLIAEGADLDFVTVVDESIALAPWANITWWRQLFRAAGRPVLVVADPLSPLLESRDQRDDGAMREVFDRIKKALFKDTAEHPCAFVGVRHFNKRLNAERLASDPLDNINGSKAGLVGVPRSILFCYKIESPNTDDETWIGCSVEKSNLTRKEGTPVVAFRIQGASIPTRDGSPGHTSRMLHEAQHLAPSFLEQAAKLSQEAQESAGGELVDDALKAFQSELAPRGWATSAELTQVCETAGLSASGSQRASFNRRLKMMGWVSARRKGKSGATGFWYDSAIHDEQGAQELVMVAAD